MQQWDFLKLSQKAVVVSSICASVIILMLSQANKSTENSGGVSKRFWSIFSTGGIAILRGELFPDTGNLVSCGCPHTLNET